MSDFVMITGLGYRFEINETERNAVLNAIEQGKKIVFLKRHNMAISLQLAPNIFPFNVWYTQENENLARSGKRLCKLCFSIMHAGSVCDCWEELSLGAKKNVFDPPELPQEVKKLLHE